MIAVVSCVVGITFLSCMDLFTGALGVRTEALCFSDMEPDLSCGAPTRERWFYNQYTGQCTVYRTCSLPTKIYVNDFSSKEKCERICTEQSTDCPRSCSLANGTCVRQGNLALYACQTGFTLVGPKHRVCQNGVWSGTDPQCCRLRIAMDSVALEGDRLLINSGKSNIILDCTMDPEFSHECSPIWSFERDKQSTTQALPWGVHSFWAEQGKVFRLRINRIGSEQAGNYTCTAGILNRTLEIQVNKAPVLSEKSFTSKQVSCGSTHKLLCVFRGDPAPNITWLMGGKQLNKSGGTVMTFSYPIGVDGDHFVFSFLLLSPVTMASSGPYQCKAINEKGAAVVNMGQLLVACDVPHNVTNSIAVCRTATWVLGARVTQQADLDRFGIQVKQVLKSPTNSTSAASVKCVRLIGYACWCHRVQINNTYVFTGTLSGGEGNVLQVDLKTNPFWDLDDSPPQQNCL